MIIFEENKWVLISPSLSEIKSIGRVFSEFTKSLLMNPISMNTEATKSLHIFQSGIVNINFLNHLMHEKAEANNRKGLY